MFEFIQKVLKHSHIYIKTKYYIPSCDFCEETFIINIFLVSFNVNYITIAEDFLNQNFKKANCKSCHTPDGLGNGV